ncbi:PAS domain S-box protein [Bradyrhizobium rifense]|uniref:histidine kinase n=2 Tax=Bradyrhizobium rifense TaxID=515499 RepID=A0A5D3K7W2_9BRAD|nr:PAS domain S-box protein [Bradyrhizobium rifense]
MSSDQPASELSETVQQINDLFDSAELSKALETEEFKQFLDHIPIAIAVSKLFRGDQRICYANKAFETLFGHDAKDCAGKGWSILAGFTDENDANVTLDLAVLKDGGEFLGTFRTEQPRPLLVEAFSGLIQNEDGTENYRIAALIDVTDRARAEREEYARRIRDKDILLRELQHRVKNNLQLIVALIRLEARNERRGEKVDLHTLAGRIESLHLLYQALSNEAAGGEVDLGHYLSQIAAAIMNTCAVEGVRLEQKTEYAPVSVNTALSVGLVVNEVLTNSFKYAFEGRGHGVITIECLRRSDDRYRVVVADDGVGLHGITWPIPGKIGALIVQTLRENAKSDFDVESAPGRGVRVTMNVGRKAIA